MGCCKFTYGDDHTFIVKYESEDDDEITNSCTAIFVFVEAHGFFLYLTKCQSCLVSNFQGYVVYVVRMYYLTFFVFRNDKCDDE